MNRDPAGAPDVDGDPGTDVPAPDPPAPDPPAPYPPAPDPPAPDPPAPDPPAPDPERLTGTPLTRRLLSIVAVLLIGSMVVSALPSSELRDRLRTVERPITDVTGLSQNWNLFAPTPRDTVLRLRAEIERADGTVTEWTPPVGDRVVGVYRTYRWRKWANGVVDRDASRLHRGAASYLRARFADESTSPIVEVRLYRGTFQQPRPGSGQPADRDPPFEEELLLRSVTPHGDEGGGG